MRFGRNIAITLIACIAVLLAWLSIFRPLAIVRYRDPSCACIYPYVVFLNPIRDRTPERIATAELLRTRIAVTTSNRLVQVQSARLIDAWTSSDETHLLFSVVTVGQTVAEDVPYEVVVEKAGPGWVVKKVAMLDV